MSKLGGPNETLLTELITANAKPTIPPAQPAGPGFVRRPGPVTGLPDQTIPGQQQALRARRRAEARQVLLLAAVVVVPILGGVAETVIR